MSFLRRAKKVDATQPAIVEALEKAGYHVIVLGLPVDLLVRHKTWANNVWVLLEAKSKEPNGKHYVRKAMKEQTEFCHEHGVPYVFEAEESLAYLKLRGMKLVDA